MPLQRKYTIYSKGQKISKLNYNVSKILLIYEEALCQKNWETGHASQILTNDHQIFVLS
jgi:hypothetical protein